MSLQSTGSSYTIYPQLPERNKDKLKELKSKERIPNDWHEGEKKRFLEAMTDFANSAEFEASVYQLENHFNINVVHSVHLSMPG